MKGKSFLGSFLLLVAGIGFAQAPVRYQPPHPPYIIPETQRIPADMASLAPPRPPYAIPESQRGVPPPEAPTLLERLRNTRPRELLNPATLRGLLGGNSP
jgi:hypothetical protein